MNNLNCIYCQSKLDLIDGFYVCQFCANNYDLSGVKFSYGHHYYCSIYLTINHVQYEMLTYLGHRRIQKEYVARSIKSLFYLIGNHDGFHLIKTFDYNLNIKPSNARHKIQTILSFS